MLSARTSRRCDRAHSLQRLRGRVHEIYQTLFRKARASRSQSLNDSAPFSDRHGLRSGHGARRTRPTRRIREGRSARAIPPAGARCEEHPHIPVERPKVPGEGVDIDAAADPPECGDETDALRRAERRKRFRPSLAVDVAQVRDAIPPRVPALWRCQADAAERVADHGAHPANEREEVWRRHRAPR